MAAVAHHYSFSYLPYLRPGSNQNCCRAFLAMWDVSDVGRDIQEHLGIVGKYYCFEDVVFTLTNDHDYSGSSISRRIRGRSMYSIPRGDDELSHLITRTGSSAPASSFYQSEEETYGSVASNQPNLTDRNKQLVI